MIVEGADQNPGSNNLPKSFGAKCPVSSIKEEVKKKSRPARANFSFFAAH